MTKRTIKQNLQVQSKLTKTQIKALTKAGYTSKQGTDGRILILTCIMSPVFPDLDTEIRWILRNYDELLSFSARVKGLTFAERPVDPKPEPKPTKLPAWRKCPNIETEGSPDFLGDDVSKMRVATRNYVCLGVDMHLIPRSRCRGCQAYDMPEDRRIPTNTQSKRRESKNE